MRVSTFTIRLLLLSLPATVGVLATACSDNDPSSTVVVDRSKEDAATLTKYIADNNITNAQRQASGLYYVPVRTDSAAVRATAGKTVSVLYTGKLLDGTVFDASSRHGNTPFDFVLGHREVIDGWDQGIALMHKGDKAQLLIPSGLAYGARGSGAIPPNAVIMFDVELVSVK